MQYPLADIQADFEINRPVRYQNTAKRNYFHRRTDRRTDGQTSRTITIGIFLRKKNTKKYQDSAGICLSIDLTTYLSVYFQPILVLFVPFICAHDDKLFFYKKSTKQTIVAIKLNP